VAATGRDYYEVLEIERGADDQQIKRAFRRLARELHPDVSEAPDAEARFKEVVEAYEVLSKSETRELYDRYGHAGLKTGGFQPGHFDFGNLSDLFSAFFGDDLFGSGGRTRAARGADLAATVEVELVEAATGTTREVPFQIAARCETCAGDGVAPGTMPKTCPACQGSGRSQQVARSVFGEFVRSQPCRQCAGSGRIVEHPCEDCDGVGRRLEERVLDVTIPPGIHDGQRIRLSGEGHAGTLGGRAGDVYVQVRVKPDVRFVREGNDIVSTVDVNIVEAALGAKVTVPTLAGDEELDLPPGTQAGSVIVLRRRGMPVLQGFGTGDHRVLVNVVVPRNLSDEQRRLLQEFERASNEENYTREPEDESFFDKLKSAFR
jgi:molecular chaperone DnaJ